MNNQWLNDLRRKMEDHEEDIPDGLWEDIKDKLFSGEEENGIAGVMLLGTDDKKEDKSVSVVKRSSLWYRVGGIAAAVAMLFFTGKLLLEINSDTTGVKITKSSGSDKIEDIDKNITKPLKTNKEQFNTGSGEKYGSQGEKLTDRTDTNPVFGNVFNKKITDHGKTLSEFIKKETGLELLTKKELPFYNLLPSINKNALPEGEQESEKIFNKNQNDLPEKYAAHDKPKTFVRQPKKWMLSMLTGNVSPNSSDQKYPGYTTMSGNPMTFSDVLITSTETDPVTEVLLANQSKEVEARIRHKIPVTFGLSMYYNIGKRWGIGTGVNYTKLTSELHSGSNSNYIKGDQSVHYIGIPVQVNYNVVQKGRFTGYVTGGVLAEKAVAGKLKTQYIVNDEVQETQEERLDVKPVQVSVNSAVGLQVKIIDKIGIYAEPGIGYHFKNDSQLNTIYKEKPLNFNMKFGIRILLD